ncbi:N2227-domain-containing protein [Tothia fuscella]|uniref:N2227-domain-containing protein n=1 Tax=Tothia fuscella TaxID=1048955 RepID=A0A9P4NTJ0_9PEZI|nr:N2227-domain-containing protein [Tothia fuscella]
MGFVEASSARHVAEKKRLIQSYEKSEENWSVTHPRYRMLQALHGFVRYQERYQAQVQEWREAYESLPEAQRKVLESATTYHKKFDRLMKLWEINGKMSEEIVKHALSFYHIPQHELDGYINEAESIEQWDNQAAVSDAINHLARDWSTDGLHERVPTFAPILETIKEHFPDRSTRKEGPVRILQPGIGVGRLPHDMARLGYVEVTSNEWSQYMNVVYRYMETLTVPNSVSWHPYIDWWSHQPTPEEHEHKVIIPDIAVNASSVLHVEGDFMTVFENQTAHYDVVVTLFFIDTGKNTLEYLDNINRLLKPGGFWINMGPLLYGTSPQLQMSLEEVVNVSERMGFEFLETDEKWGEITIPGKTVRGQELGYLFNKRAMRRNMYMAQFSVAKKTGRDYPEFPKTENEPFNFAPGSKF